MVGFKKSYGLLYINLCIINISKGELCQKEKEKIILVGNNFLWV